MQWGAHVQSWAQVEAGGSPGQRVEAALEVQVVSGLVEELTRFLVLMLKDIIKIKIKNQSIIPCCMLLNLLSIVLTAGKGSFYQTESTCQIKR